MRSDYSWLKRNLTTFFVEHVISTFLIAIDIRYLIVPMSTDFSRDRVKFRHSLFDSMNYKWRENATRAIGQTPTVQLLFNWCIKK